MKIDIFRDKTMWKFLEQFNNEVIEVANTMKYPGCTYDTAKGEASNWFDPNKIKLTPIANTEYYPKPHPKQLDPKYNLILHTANYPTLFVTNVLYHDRKEEIIFEDICCGQSQVSYYLAKLGFKTFNFIDNFCQMPRELLVNLMNKTDATYTINYLAQQSTIYNIVAYPMFPKRRNGHTNYLHTVLEPPPLCEGSNHTGFLIRKLEPINK